MEFKIVDGMIHETTSTAVSEQELKERRKNLLAEKEEIAKMLADRNAHCDSEIAKIDEILSQIGQ